MMSRKKIKKKQLQDGIIPSTGSELALDTTNFNDNLDSTITDIQKLADKVDDLNTVRIYDELPLEIEGQVAYAQGKFYGGDGSEWKELGGGEPLPSGTTNQTLRHNGTTWEATKQINIIDNSTAGEASIIMGTAIATSYPKTTISKSQSSAYMGVYYSYTKTVEFSANDTSSTILVQGNNARIQIINSLGVGAYISTISAKFTFLSGSGSALLEALPDGTIQRSTTTIPAAQIQSDWNQTDDTQVDFIKNKPTIPQGETVNIETLTGNKTLTASDATVQIYTCTANRVINLPTTELALGQKFEIWNNSGASSVSHIEVRQIGSALYRIDTLNKIELRWDGTTWITEWKWNISIGANTYDNYSGGIGVGNNAYHNAYEGIGIGNYANNNSQYGIGIGNNASGNERSGIGIGKDASNNYNYGIGIGRRASGNSNYSIGLGAFAGNGQSRANTLYIHSSDATVGANSLIYGEFDNRIVRINNTLYVNDLAGTGDRPIVADSTGKLKIGTATGSTRKYNELITEPSTVDRGIFPFTNTQLGLDGINLLDKLKRLDVLLVSTIGTDTYYITEGIDSVHRGSGGINVATTNVMPVGTQFKIYLEYID